MHTQFEVPVPKRVRHLLAMSSVALLAFGCDSGSTGPNCNTLEGLEIVGLVEILTAGQPLQLTVDAEPSTCTPQVVWSASPGITIDQTGMVVGDQVGGPFTITAMAGGLTATGEVSVATSAAVADSRWALAWLNELTTPEYTVSNNWQYSSGGDIRATRTGTGAYTVTFVGLASQAGQRQTVQVSAYSTGVPSRCRILSTGNQGLDLVAQIRCHTLAGAPADSQFDLLVVPAGSMSGRSAFLVSTSPNGGVVPAATAHSSALLPIHVTRVETGRYTVVFEGLSRNFVPGSGPEHPQISAYGDGTAWCKISSWTSLEENLEVNVRCFTPEGVPADATFSALVMERGRTGKRLGYVWASDHTSDITYTPAALYNFNSSSTPNTAVRTSVGVYNVTWTGLGRIGGSTAETNLITAYGSDATYGQVEQWFGSSTIFRCFAPNGSPADSQFNAVWIE